MTVYPEQVNLPYQDENALPAPIPVTILTGFLGSGKTTLLNHILGSGHGLKVAVIVNDFGDISIDDKLISQRAHNIIELANGCVCCSMQGDLLKAIHQVTDTSINIDYILLETSGLSDPLPVAASILNNEPGNVVRLDGIVTVVDAWNFDANLEHAEVAFSQLVNTDLILINKIDLVEEHVPGLIQQGIQKINPAARMLTCANGKVDPSLLLDVNLSRLKHHWETPPAAGHDTPDNGRRHKDGLSGFDSISFESRKPFDPDLFRTFIDEIPANVYRGKGLLNIAGDNHRRVFQLVGERCVVSKGRPWTPGENRTTQLVLIGRQLRSTGLLDRLHEL